MLILFRKPHVTRDFGIEIPPVNEEHKHEAAPTSGNYFRMSQKYNMD